MRIRMRSRPANNGQRAGQVDYAMDRIANENVLVIDFDVWSCQGF